jgi:hypothetical protein
MFSKPMSNNNPVQALCSYKSSSRHKIKRENSFDDSSSDDTDEDDDYSNNNSTNNNDDDDDDDDADEEFDNNSSVFQSNIIKSTRFAPIDLKLSKAVAQYSDDYDNDDNENESDDNNTYSFNESNLDSKEIKRSQSTNDILKFNYNSNRGVLNNKRYSVNIADVVNSIPNPSSNVLTTNNLNINSNSDNTLINVNTNNDFNNFNINNNKCLKHSGNIPSQDFIARSRCFEYLVGAIDEAWARYCDSTSYDEDVAYGYGNGENDYESNVSNNQIVVNTPSSNTYSSDDDEGYKTEFSATTTVTEYDSDFNNNTNNHNKPRSFSIMNNNIKSNNTNSNNNNNNNKCCPANRRVSEVPENLRLQELKDRFTKSKYFLEDLVDSDVYNECLTFWTKWDLIKYSIVDFVEEDEEDDDIERKIEELEAGRFAGSLLN